MVHNTVLPFSSSVTLASPLASLSLSFFICKMGIITHFKERPS